MSVNDNDPADERDEYIIDYRDIVEIDDGLKHLLVRSIMRLWKYTKPSDSMISSTFSFGNGKCTGLFVSIQEEAIEGQP